MENEKKVWEVLLYDGWTQIGKHNLNDDGSLENYAQSLKDKGFFQFRQTAISEIGKGDSNGKTKIILEMDDSN